MQTFYNCIQSEMVCIRIQLKVVPLFIFSLHFHFFHPRTKNGVNVSDVDELKGRLDILDDSIQIRNSTYSDNGNYTCSIKELNLEANIRAIGL